MGRHSRPAGRVGWGRRSGGPVAGQPQEPVAHRLPAHELGATPLLQDDAFVDRLVRRSGDALREAFADAVPALLRSLRAS